MSLKTASAPQHVNLAASSTLVVAIAMVATPSVRPDYSISREQRATPQKPRSYSPQPDSIQRPEDAIDRIAVIRADWDGYGAEAPNGTSIYNAKTVFRVVSGFGLQLSHAGPNADGGVTMIVSGEKGKRAVFELLNSGDAIMVISDPNGPIDLQEFDPMDEEKIEEIATHVRESLS